MPWAGLRCERHPGVSILSRMSEKPHPAASSCSLIASNLIAEMLGIPSVSCPADCATDVVSPTFATSSTRTSSGMTTSNHRSCARFASTAFISAQNTRCLILSGTTSLANKSASPSNTLFSRMGARLRLGDLNPTDARARNEPWRRPRWRGCCRERRPRTSAVRHGRRGKSGCHDPPAPAAAGAGRGGASRSRRVPAAHRGANGCRRTHPRGPGGRPTSAWKP